MSRKIFIAIRVSGDIFIIHSRADSVSTGGENDEKLMFLELIQDDLSDV